jgi:hypothetical protein
MCCGDVLPLVTVLLVLTVAVIAVVAVVARVDFECPHAVLKIRNLKKIPFSRLAVHHHTELCS